MRSIILAVLLCGSAMAFPKAHAATFQINDPSADRWMYPFASDGGGQTAIQTFGAVGNSSFDNRDGQMYLRFDTTGIAPAGLGASNYQLTSLTLTLTLSVSGTIYDPTSDSYTTYLPGGTDADAGRPVELFGVGFRNDVTAATWGENSAFGPGNIGKGIRSVYAAGYNAAGQLIDVSNNVDDGFEAIPWAVGMVAGATPGSLLSADSQMTFTLNLNDPLILAYLQTSLNGGFIDLMVTSMYPASDPSTTTGPQPDFPRFYSKENLLNDPESTNPFDHVAGQLSGSVVVVPEPATLVLLGLAVVGLIAARCGKKRRHA